ncbi:putative calcium-transporting ATPase [Propionispora sp. 2/2-37]|uniref:calcium-transporting P-type ATPase, PMR1-type n=1 Tax=Propionispora sp. 2/2-37 TaxID=1677858 RepID=UPI0006BB95B7|nr:calcium-transporting P-type ATPase, PMR1-type [Propionispora sp. 2/2-37]CUH94202.1 putative calcium-transporting ATPase [Propionispora sp. 2/2-37]
MDKWHARSLEEIVDFWKLNASEGLSSKTVKTRQEEFGFNEMAVKEPIGWWKQLLMQFQDFMVLVLLAATLISAFLGEYADAITILIIVIINAVLGFIQEFRAEKSLQALQELSAPTARVIRNGMLQQIPAREMVPGDLMVIEAGDKLAADGRLLEAQNLEIEEAALTGESVPVSKLANQVYDENSALGDRKNMIYAGTSVTKGRGKAVVCSTGMETEVGCIAGMIQSTEQEKTPLERRLARLGHFLVWGCLLICLIVVITGVLKGEPLFLMCMAGISLAVAAIPEGLPAIVTVSLALGVQRMIRRNAIIRKLPAVETLGCTTVICSDKTGTLTQNKMTVRKIFSGGNLFDVTGNGYDIHGKFFLQQQEINPRKDKALEACLTAGTVCNNSILKHNKISISGLWRRSAQEEWSIEGDPTEGALVVAAGKADIWRETLEKTQKRIGEIPFSSERRSMSVLYGQKGMYTLYTKGAADTVLDSCKYYNKGNVEVAITPEIRSLILQVHDEMASQALRVLAVAYRKFSPRQIDVENLDERYEKDLVFTGLIGMIDPPREEVKHAINLCRKAGIKTVMITGDHRDTAIAIARELQIFQDNDTKALTGSELDGLNEKELTKVVDEVAIYARVSPAHKLRIVKALKSRGNIVAMTGDGINDAPAIKEANIGVSMGKTGTDVTKEASAMILTDDNFTSIVAAVEEGRAIYENIRKFIRYLLSCNLGEVLTMLIASLLGFPLPLLPVQILWVNLVTDGLPAMALGVDPHTEEIMNRPPRNPEESVFSRGLSRKIITRGLQIGGSTVLIFALVYYLQNNLQLARTMAFVTLVLSQMFHVFDCRSERLTAFEVGLGKNKYLLLAVLCSIIMQVGVIYHPLLQSIFQTVPLGIGDWLLVLVLSGWTFVLSGIHCIFRRKNYMVSQPEKV